MAGRTVLLVVSMFLSRAIAFLVTPLYYKQLSVQAVAELETLAILTALTAIIAGLELNQAVARFFPSHMNDTLSRRSYFELTRIISLTTLTVTCAGLIAVISIHDVDYKHLLAVLSGCIAIAFVNLTQSYLRSTFKDIELVRFNFILATLVLINTLAFYAFNLLSPITFISIPIAATTMATVYIIKPRFNELFKALSPDEKRTSEYLQYSFPLLIAATIHCAYFYADRAYLINSLSAHDLAVYSLGIKFTTITSFIFIAAGIIITPRIMRAGEGDYSFSLIKIGIYSCVSAIFIALIISEFFQDFIVLTIATVEYLKVANYIVCFITIATLTSSYVFMPGVEFKKKTQLHLIPIIAATGTFIIVAVINPATNIADIIFAKLISAYVLFLVQHLINSRYITPSIPLLAFNSTSFLYSILKTI